MRYIGLHLNTYIVALITVGWRWNIFSKAALFISGLIFVHSFVDKALIDILIVHLPDLWKHTNLSKEAQLVNIQEGVSAVLQIFCAFVTDAYFGRFTMVILSSLFYIIGLLLFWIVGWYLPSIESRIFYLALVLVVLAKAAKEISLKAFLDDQFLISEDMSLPVVTHETDRRRPAASSNVWDLFARILAVIAAFICTSVTNESWHRLSMISAIVFVVGFMCFLLGTTHYIYKKPTGSPLTDVLFVIKRAISKRNLHYPHHPWQLFKNTTGLVQILPSVWWLRWLDKAAIVPEKVCTVLRVKEVKFLLRMIPMWITFLAYSLVYAAGSTFFLQQATSMDENPPVVIFSNIPTLTSFIIAYFSELLCEKLSRIMNGQRVMHARIGLGMIFSFLCSLTSWRIAVGIQNSVYANVYILTPQFVLLGIMKGLSEDGLSSFFNSQVSESLRIYGPPFGECVTGVGKFLSALCILIFSSWFKADITSSRLDKYYEILAILSCLNVILYSLLVSYWYGDDKYLPEGEFLQNIENGFGQTLPQDICGPLVFRSLSDQTHKNRTTQPSSTAVRRAHSALSGPSTRKRENEQALTEEFGSTSLPGEDSMPLLNVPTGQMPVNGYVSAEEDSLQLANDDDEGTREYGNIATNRQPTSSANANRSFSRPILSKPPSGIRLRSFSMK